MRFDTFYYFNAHRGKGGKIYKSVIVVLSENDYFPRVYPIYYWPNKKREHFYVFGVTNLDFTRAVTRKSIWENVL